MTACPINRIHACKPRLNRFRSTIGQPPIARTVPRNIPPTVGAFEVDPIDAKCSGEASRLGVRPCLDTLSDHRGVMFQHQQPLEVGDCSLSGNHFSMVLSLQGIGLAVPHASQIDRSPVSSRRPWSCRIRSRADHLPHLCQRPATRAFLNLTAPMEARPLPRSMPGSPTRLTNCLAELDLRWGGSGRSPPFLFRS